MPTLADFLVPVSSAPDENHLREEGFVQVMIAEMSVHLGREGMAAHLVAGQDTKKGRGALGWQNPCLSWSPCGTHL